MFYIIKKTNWCLVLVIIVLILISFCSCINQYKRVDFSQSFIDVPYEKEAEKIGTPNIGIDLWEYNCVFEAKHIKGYVINYMTVPEVSELKEQITRFAPKALHYINKVEKSMTDDKIVLIYNIGININEISETDLDNILKDNHFSIALEDKEGNIVKDEFDMSVLPN